MTKETIPYFAITTPYDAAYRNNSSKNPVGPHTHNATELYLTHTELSDVLINNTVFQVPAGSLIIIPPFCVHQLYHKADVPYERYVLSIHSDWLSHIFWKNTGLFAYLKTGADSTFLPLSDDSLSDITTAFQSVLQTEYGADTSAILALIRLLQLIDTAMKQTLPDKATMGHISASQKKVNEMITYIHEHLTEQIGLAELSAHFFLNPDYLSRLFKQHTHTTVGRYIAIQKITKAQAMLREGNSVTEIQETLGYSSYAHFVKTFKKITGMTPGQYTRCFRFTPI